MTPLATSPRAARRCTAAEAFQALWVTLSDVIGPTASAALMQRSLRRASAKSPELSHVVIAREHFVYTYTLPASWTQAAAEPTALTHMVRELWPLLSELTGSVVIRRLRQDPVLQRCGVIPKDLEQ